MSSLKQEYSEVTQKLVGAGLRPTRQRILLGSLLFTDPCRHVTAETLHGESRAAKFDVSLATVYNTLHQFTEAGLLREIVVESGRSYFDTNNTDHHHFLCEDTGDLTDIPESEISINGMPDAPSGRKVSGVQVIVRVCKEA